MKDSRYKSFLGLKKRSPRQARHLQRRQRKELIGIITIVGFCLVTLNFNTLMSAYAAGQEQFTTIKSMQKPSPRVISPLWKRDLLAKTPIATPTIAFADPRVDKLTTMLEEKGSPLAPYATLIIEQADKYDIGWTRLYAISGIESSFGKQIKEDSHNAWGIGGDTDFMYFDSWEEGIIFTSRMLGKHYSWNANKGIQSKYCPTDTCDEVWAERVTEFSQEVLEK